MPGISALLASLERDTIGETVRRALGQQTALQGHFDILSQTAALRNVAMPSFELFKQFEHTGPFSQEWSFASVASTAADAMRLYSEQDERFRLAGLGGIADAANRAAELASSFQMPDFLSAYRLPFEDMSARLSWMPSPDLLVNRSALELVNSAAAMAQVYDTFDTASRAMAEAVRSFTAFSGFDGSLNDYRTLLDISGLRLPRLPSIRLLSRAEKRMKLKALIAGNKEPAHVRKAKSLVHGYERTLRMIVDDAMADFYGEDWPEQRLGACDCKDLLGKWRRRGGDALDHADYHHYAELVSHPEHFENIFSRGFEDRDEAKRLFRFAGNLRAASHHGREFTVDDLRDLTLTWKTIAKGLEALLADYTVEYR
jgi:hypothetical protein